MAKQNFFIHREKGCIDSYLEMARLQDFLQTNSFVPVDDISKADYIFMYTCAAIEKDENRSLDSIARIKSCSNSDATLIVMGCLPDINNGKLKGVTAIDIFGNGYVGEKFDLCERVGSLLGLNGPTPNIFSGSAKDIYGFQERNFNGENQNFSEKLLLLIERQYNEKNNSNNEFFKNLFNFDESDVYYVRPSVGCANACSFCAIKNTRGSVKSVFPDTVLRSVSSGLRRGFRKIKLVGEDFASYGLDIECTASGLLKSILALDSDLEVFIKNLEPGKALSQLEELKILFESGRIKYVNIPLQSASDNVLNLMNRKYSVDEFFQLVDYVSAHSSDTVIKTHVIVGFPGESKDDFRKTVQMFENHNFPQITVYSYCTRPNTHAAFLPGQLEKSVIKERYSVLSEITKQSQESAIFAKVRQYLNIKGGLV